MLNAKLFQLPSAGEDVEELVKECNSQRALNLLGWSDQFQISSSRANGGKKRRDRSNSGAIDVIDAAEIEGKCRATSLKHLITLGGKVFASVSNRDSSGTAQNRNRANLVVDNDVKLAAIQAAPAVSDAALRTSMGSVNATIAFNPSWSFSPLLFPAFHHQLVPEVLVLIVVARRVALWQKLFGQSFSGTLFIPFRESDPPAMAIEKHFDAVDAARGWRTVRRFP